MLNDFEGSEYEIRCHRGAFREWLRALALVALPQIPSSFRMSNTSDHFRKVHMTIRY